MSKVTRILIKEAGTQERSEVSEHLFQAGTISFLAEEALAVIGGRSQPGFCMKRFKGDIQTSGFDFKALTVGDQLLVGPLKVKVIQVGKVCHSEDCTAYEKGKTCFMVSSTLFAEIMNPGIVVVGDSCRPCN